MKKFLSLVLALVMTMSLVTISAGAKDFTDDDKVNYAEAIDVLSEVKVIDGYTDGSFKPQTQLNRGQAAKILCNMILGPTTASALKADSAPFKDVAADSTFAGYIAYCAQAGIIDGYTDGTFRPAAPLTGYAFMKLLLGALGYDKDIEGYNVPNWSINVAKQALAIGLDDGLVADFDGTKIVTREEACLYALNTLKATMVDYDSRTTVSIGGTEIVVGGSKAEPVAQTGYTNKMNKNNLQFAEKYFGNLGRQDVQDAYGRPANKWTLKTSSIGTYVKAGTKVASYTKKVAEGSLYELIGSSLYDDLKAGRADLKVYMNGSNAVAQLSQVGFDTAAYGVTGLAMFDKNSGSKVGGAGVLTEVYVDDTKTPVEVTVIGKGTYLFQASEDYNARKETVKIAPAGDTTAFIAAADFNSLTLSQDDFDVKDVKADDYLLVTAAWNGSKFAIKSVTPAEVKTGVVNSYDVKSGVTLDGEDLSYSFATKKTGGVDNVVATSYVVGQNASLVVDTYGNIIGIDSNYVAANYVYVYEAKNVSGLHGGNVKAAAYFTDGTNADVTVKKIYGSAPVLDINNEAISYGSEDGWYTFSKNSKDEYNLMQVETKYASGNEKTTFGASVYDFVQNGKVNFLNASANLTSGSATVKGDSKTVFVVLEADGTVSTFTGIKNIPDIRVTAGTATVTYLKDGSYADFVFVDLTQATATIKGQATSDLLYVVEYKGQTYVSENNTYYTYKVLDDNGDVVTVKTDAQILGTGDVFDLYYKARKNADGYITQLTQVTNAEGGKMVGAPLVGTVTYSNGSLNLGGTEFTVADDAKIVLVTLDSKLMKDHDADYEVYNNISARTLGALLNNYTISGAESYFAGVKTDSTSDELTTLYVTVDTLS